MKFLLPNGSAVDAVRVNPKKKLPKGVEADPANAGNYRLQMENGGWLKIRAGHWLFKKENGTWGTAPNGTVNQWEIPEEDDTKEAKQLRAKKAGSGQGRTNISRMQ